MPDLKIVFVPAITEIPQSEWNSVTGIQNPFLRYEFLHALEASRCVYHNTGWQPQHLLIKDANQQILGLMPSYLKYHSYGEYVFDWAWADAYQRCGRPYYPKLISAIPYTPSVGPRLVIKPGVSQQHHFAQKIIAAVAEQASIWSLSSWHILFPDDMSRSLLHNSEQAARPLSLRTACQFQWHNRGFACFDDFLELMTSRKRKNIRSERSKVVEQGITFKAFEGHNISDQLINTFYRFYQATNLKRGQQAYLNQRFFQLLRDAMPENLLLVMAEKQGRFVAGAFSLKNNETLYGRYWGCLDEFKFLHFETCYYQGIEYCIQQQLHLFDSGAQGEHKIQRGFEPTKTYSLHWLQQPEFHQAVDRFLEQEAQQINRYIKEARAGLPFRKT